MIKKTISLLFLCSVAHASGDDVAVATDVHVNSPVQHTSRAYGLGGGDMVINDGYRTYSVAFGLWQGTQVNLLDLARDLAAEGNFHAAATLRCKPRAVSKSFGGMDACIDALSVQPVVEVVTTPDAHLEDEEEYHEEQQMLYSDMQSKIANLEAELNSPPPPRVIRETVVEQRPLLTKEQADDLRVKK